MLKNLEKLKELSNKEEEPAEKEEQEEDFGTIKNKEVLKVSKDILAGITANIKLLFNQINIPITKKDIKAIGVKRCPNNFCNKPSTFVQMLKINMSCVSVNQLFNFFNNQEQISILEENNIFISVV